MIVYVTEHRYKSGETSIAVFMTRAQAEHAREMLAMVGWLQYFPDEPFPLDGDREIASIHYWRVASASFTIHDTELEFDE